VAKTMSNGILVSKNQRKKKKNYVFFFGLMFLVKRTFIEMEMIRYVFFFSTFVCRAFKEAFQDQNFYSLKFKRTSFKRPPSTKEII
jgi:hypothetical protein